MCSSFVTPWHQIKALIKTYIQRQETINLVVVPCNVDIATTEALSMAQEVDPDGDRTIGKKKAPTGSRGRPLRYLEGPGCNSPVRGAHILHQIRALFPGKLRGLRVQLHTADGPPSLMVRARCMANIWRFFALLPIVPYLHSQPILDRGREMPYFVSHNGPERRKRLAHQLCKSRKRSHQGMYEHSGNTLPGLHWSTGVYRVYIQIELFLGEMGSLKFLY